MFRLRSQPGGRVAYVSHIPFAEIEDHMRAVRYCQRAAGKQINLWDQVNDIIAVFSFVLNTEQHWHKHRTLLEFAQEIEKIYDLTNPRTLYSVRLLRQASAMDIEEKVA